MCDDAVAVLVELAGNKASVLVRDVMAATLHEIADLVLRDHTVSIEIDKAEGCGWVEVGITLQILTSGLCGSFLADHCPQQVFEGAGCRVGEHVVFAIDVDASVCAGATTEHLCIVWVFRCERLCELSVVESAVTVLIVALEEQLAIVLRNMHANVTKAVLQVQRRDCTDVVDVKHAEGVVGVEVRILDCLILGHLEVLVQVHLLTDHANDSCLRLSASRLVKAA